MITLASQSSKVLIVVTHDGEDHIRELPIIAWVKDDDSDELIPLTPFGTSCKCAVDLADELSEDLEGDTVSSLIQFAYEVDGEVYNTHGEHICNRRLADLEGENFWLRIMQGDVEKSSFTKRKRRLID